MDAAAFIQKYDHPSALFYCDPPYLHESRVTTGDYECEMSDDEHSALLHVLLGIKGKFLLSGYPSELYSDWAARHGIRMISREIDNKASSKRSKESKTECLWMNY